jgi:hypothetical protein
MNAIGPCQHGCPNRAVKTKEINKNQRGEKETKEKIGSVGDDELTADKGVLSVERFAQIMWWCVCLSSARSFTTTTTPDLWQSQGKMRVQDVYI